MASMNRYQEFVAKTSNYTILAGDNGVTFTNRGAGGAVTLTLPAVQAGLYYRAIVAAAQTLTVAAPTADTLLTYNDAAADSVASNTLGAQMEFVCDGTAWIANLTTVGVTYTVNT